MVFETGGLPVVSSAAMPPAPNETSTTDGGCVRRNRSSATSAAVRPADSNRWGMSWRKTPRAPRRGQGLRPTPSHATPAQAGRQAGAPPTPRAAGLSRAHGMPMTAPSGPTKPARRPSAMPSAWPALRSRSGSPLDIPAHEGGTSGRRRHTEPQAARRATCADAGAPLTAGYPDDHAGASGGAPCHSSPGSRQAVPSKHDDVGSAVQMHRDVRVLLEGMQQSAAADTQVQLLAVPTPQTGRGRGWPGYGAPASRCRPSRTVPRPTATPAGLGH